MIDVVLAFLVLATAPALLFVALKFAATLADALIKRRKMISTAEVTKDWKAY